MFKSMSLLALVLLLALVAFERTSSARIQAEQPAATQDHDHGQGQDPDQAEAQAEALPPMPPVNLTGKWEFNMYGSKWTVELKPEPTKNPNDVIYCGMAARERRDADTPVVTRKLCADVEDYVLYASVPGMSCKAAYKDVVQLDGSCTAASMSGGFVSSMEASSEQPKGMFQVTRLSKPRK